MIVYKICPNAHLPKVYGECPACFDWYTLRKNKTLRHHRQCSTRSLSADAAKPTALALICTDHRWADYKRKGSVEVLVNPVQIFETTTHGLKYISS